MGNNYLKAPSLSYKKYYFLALVFLFAALLFLAYSIESILYCMVKRIYPPQFQTKKYQTFMPSLANKH